LQDQRCEPKNVVDSSTLREFWKQQAQDDSRKKDRKISFRALTATPNSGIISMKDQESAGFSNLQKLLK
jgi:hypothetical protein